MRILAVGAHPDDLEQLCGGTIARFVDAGHEVVMCHASTGDCGSFVHTRAEIRAIREVESHRAADILGARRTTLGLSDGQVNAADPDQRLLAIDLLRQYAPDVILTHAPFDYMADHNEVSKLIVDASHLATLPLIETAHAPHHTVAAVFYIETLAGVGFQPVEFVDITAVIQRKLDALRAHESQLSWLRDHDGVDIVEQTRTLSALRGFQSGVTYAEGFIPVTTWLRNRVQRLLP